MRFVDFLKSTVLACGAAATALAAVTVAAAASNDELNTLYFAAAWWLVAALMGTVLGRRNEALPAIARLLGEARATTTLPEQGSPSRILLNRLWPLLVAMVGGGILAVVAPQIPAIAAGFAIIWALYWRKQDGAVTAIEERDGIAFFIEPTSPLKPIQLVRTPGFRRIAAAPSTNGLG